MLSQNVVMWLLLTMKKTRKNLSSIIMILIVMFITPSTSTRPPDSVWHHNSSTHEVSFLIPDGSEQTTDFDKTGKNELLGNLRLDLANVIATNGKGIRWFPFTEVKSGQILSVSDFVNGPGNNIEGLPSALMNTTSNTDTSHRIEGSKGDCTNFEVIEGVTLLHPHYTNPMGMIDPEPPPGRAKPETKMRGRVLIEKPLPSKKNIESISYEVMLDLGVSTEFPVTQRFVSVKELTDVSDDSRREVYMKKALVE